MYLEGHGTTSSVSTSKSCCCGSFSLRTGTHIIAVLYILYALGMSCMVAFVIESVVRDSGVLWELQTDSDENNRQLDYVIAVLSITCVVVLIQLIFSVLLLVGAAKNHASKCKPWLYFNLFLFWVIVTFAVVGIFYVLAAGGSGRRVAIFCGLPLLLKWYFISVVRQYVRDLKHNGNGY